MTNPLPNDPERPGSNSAQRILETAEQFFARLGFVGTRVDEIARVANINKRMIYYHYGSKEGLYQAVLEKHVRPMIEVSRQLLQTELDPREMLERLLNVYFDFLASHRLYVRLISWEVLNESSQVDQLGFRRQTFAQVVHYFEAAQRQGNIQQGVDVHRTLMAGMVLCFSYFSQMQYIQGFFDTALDDPEQYAHWKDTVLTMILRSWGMELA